MKKRAGFSLVELMIALAVISIVAAIAVPNIVGYLRQRGVTDASHRVFIDLHKYRTQAIKTRQFATITYNLPLNQYQSTLDDRTTVPNPDTTMPPIRLRNYRGNVTLAAAGPGGGAATNQIGFTTTGSCPVGGSGSVFITNQGNSSWYRIRATLAGGISLHIWNNTTNTWTLL